MIYKYIPFTAKWQDRDMAGGTLATCGLTGVGTIIRMEYTLMEDRPLGLCASSGTVGKATDILSNVPRWRSYLRWPKPPEVTGRWRSNTVPDLRLLTKADIGRGMFEEMLIYTLILNPFGYQIRHNSWSNWCAYECCNRKQLRTVI